MDKLTRKYDEKVYTRIKKQDLILLGVYNISKNNETCTFERLVAECFLNFPKLFEFKRYPAWPDSLRIDRELRTLREKGLIVGSAKDRFLLTKFGEDIAKQTENSLDGKSVLRHKRQVSAVRSTDDRLITYIKESPQFNAFLNNPNTLSISKPEFRNLMRCTLETPLRVLRQNLVYYKNLAKSYNEREVLEFLSLCETKFLSEK